MSLEVITAEEWSEYLKNVVQRQKTGRLVKGVILPFIQRLNENVARNNSVYGRPTFYSNERFVGLEVLSASEMEVVLPLKACESYKWSSGSPKNYNFFLRDERVSTEWLRHNLSSAVVLKDTSDTMPLSGAGEGDVEAPIDSWRERRNDHALAMTYGRVIVSYFAHVQFKDMVLECGALGDYDRGAIKTIVLEKENAEPVFRFQLLPRDTDFLTIHVGICLTIPTHLPLPETSDWPRCKTEQFLSKAEIASLKQAKMVHVASKPYYWRGDYREFENMLLEILERRPGRTRDCFRILKNIAGQSWCLPSGRTVVTSKILKASLFN